MTGKKMRHFMGWLPFGNSVCLSMFIVGMVTEEDYHGFENKDDYPLEVRQPLRIIELAIVQPTKDGQSFTMETQYKATEVPYFNLSKGESPQSYPFYSKDFMTHQLLTPDHAAARLYDKALTPISANQIGLVAPNPDAVRQAGQKA